MLTMNKLKFKITKEVSTLISISSLQTHKMSNLERMGSVKSTLSENDN